ncbi:MAG: hypothetical protein ACR2HI_08305 [Gaiella sp.]
MSIGAVLDEAWSLYTKFFLRFFLIAVIVFAVVNAIYGLIVVAVESGDGTSVLLALAGVAASVVGTYWLQGALVFAVQDARDGAIDASIGEIFRKVTPLLGTLIAAGLLAGIGIAIGFLLLIVPGLFLLTIWSVVAPAIVVEGKSVGEAFSRSRELVKGHGWTVFAVVLITAILSAIASGLLQLAFSFLPRFLEIFIGGTIASAVVAPFTATALTVMFFRLRDSVSPTAAL